MSELSNPLRQYFRQPALYIKLPSKGEFWEETSLQNTETGELPVFPMTAVDEITYRTPDALFNGQAVIDVVQSCIPNIKNAWNMPMVDLNAILVAIRIASYGHKMEIGTGCPKCGNLDDLEMDLRNVLDQLSMPDYTKTIKSGDIEIAFRPLSFKDQNGLNMEQFENQRLVSTIPESDLPDEEKFKRMSEVMKSITLLTIKLLTQAIASIRTPNAIVTESKYINEFLTNCDRHVFEKVRDTAIAARENSELKPIKWRCTNEACKHDYEQPISLDMSNFFGSAS